MAKKGDTVIEKLLVSIEADMDKLLEQAKKGTEEIEDELDDMEGKGKSAFKGIGAAAAKFAAITTIVQKGLSLILDTIGKVAKAGIDFFKNMVAEGVQANIVFEDYTTQFTTLLGSADAAYERIRELTIFAVKTPFELPGIVEASRVLQVFGGTTLATGDNLTMVGDIAAGVGREFSEVALWVGRVYDAMQSGRPFGIAASRLQVMGAMTGTARNELERMQQEGASGAEMWERFNELVGDRWAGNMDRLSRTLTGLISNIKDFVQNLLRVAGLPLFEELREDAAQLLAVLEEKRPELEAIGEALFEIVANVADFLATEFIDQIQNLDTDNLLKMTESLWSAAEQARTLLEIILLLGEGVKPVEALVWAFDTLNDALSLALELTTDFARATIDDVDVLARLDEILAEHDARVEAHNRRKEESVEVTKQATKAFEEEAGALEQVTDAERDAIMGFAESLMDLQDDVNKRLADLEKAHLKRMGEIVAETAKRKAEAQADAEKDILKVEEETRRAREEEAEDYHREERRSEEDHQTDMRRLRLQYMMDMADAVRSRDARAIVELRRNFKAEKQEREEDHRTRQRREREDYENRLRDLEENERRRKQEIQASLREQLADLDAAQREALAKERTSHAERQAELNRAMMERLQTIAKELADEDSINEEGARKILETLNKTFGVGGSIDALMEGFAARRRQRMIVRVTFEPEAATPTVYSPPASAGPPGYKQPGMGGYAGSFQAGGAVIARQPTIAQFGEVPELATFTPLSQLGGGRGGAQTLDINLKLSGTAPPGIRSADRDHIAAVLMQALRESGVLRSLG